MAKGDHSRAQNTLNYQGDLSQNQLDNTRNNIIPQNQDLQNRFQVSADQSAGDYKNIIDGYMNFLNNVNSPNAYSSMPGYMNFASGGRDSSLDSMGLGMVSSAGKGYQEFADTGGYRPGDIDAMRARAQGSIRSAYAGANRDIDRSKSIAGGYSPNYTAAKTRLTRDMSQNLSDSNINLEAALADAIRQGKLAGLGGMANLGTSQEGLGLNRDSINNSSRLAGLGGMNSIDQSRNASNIAGLSGMNSAYGTTPGATSMYGNLAANSNNQTIQLQQLQQALATLLTGGQQNVSQIPGNFQSAMGNIGSVMNLASTLFGIPTLFGGGSDGAGVSGLPGGTRGPF